MGLFDGVKSTVKGVTDAVSNTKFGFIERFDSTGTELVLRYPEHGSAAITAGTSLIVRENQSAIFYCDGKAMDVFGPGSHQLVTKNLPVISKFLNVVFEEGKSIFRSEIYFVNHKVYEMKWGTQQPINFRDTDVGNLRLGGHGKFSIRIGMGDNVNLFIQKYVGTQSTCNIKMVEGDVKEMIVPRLQDVLGGVMKGKSILDLAEYYDELGTALKARTKDDLAKYGLELVNFFIGAISPTPEDQKKLDELSAIMIEKKKRRIDLEIAKEAKEIGDLSSYSQLQAANAVVNISKQEGGTGGNLINPAMQIGMGFAAGNIMAQTLHPQQPQQPAPPQPAPPPQQQVVVTGAAAATVAGPPCSNCQTPLPQGAKFCATCGTKVPETGVCVECKSQLLPGAKFCPNCGSKVSQETACPNCQTKLPPGAKFCANCGNKMG